MADVEKNNRPRVRRKVKKTKNEDDTAEDQNTIDNANQGSISDLLKEAYENQELEENTKKRRRRKPAPDSQLIEAVRASLEKDQDQEVIDANLYDPQSDQKKERRTRKKKKGEENAAFEGDEAVDADLKKTKKRVKKKVEENETVELPQEEEGTPKKTRRRKKKKDADETQEVTQQEENIEEQQEEPLEEGKKVRRRKKKARGASKERLNENEEVADPETQEGGEAEPEEHIPVDPLTISDEGRVLSVIVHRTDRLKTDICIAHPLVRIHIMDMETGKYLDKQHKDRKVISFYEDVDKVGYLLPIMTQPYDFKKRRSTLPVWEEKIVFNENSNYITDNERTIIFFELLDFLSPASAASQYQVAQRESGWYRIAWAFLRPVGANGNRNIDKKVRLQLYNPPPFVRNVNPDTCYLYEWWLNSQRPPPSSIYPVYPSTIYVTLTGMKMAPEEQMQKGMRSLFPNQAEAGSMTYQNLRDMLDPGGREERLQALAASRPELWTRLPGQMCKVPNKLGLSLSSGTKGCSTVKFSHEGSRIAVACNDEGDFPLIIYDFPLGNVKCRLIGHRRLVYDLSWSRKSKLLLSASADGTARVWSVAEEKQEKVMAHPTFVYSAQFHPRVTSVVATAAYDKVVRIWGIDGDRTELDDFPHYRAMKKRLLQELDDHTGFVNSLSFNSDGRKLYSGDSAGVICVWNVFVTEQQGRPGFLRDWTLIQKITEKELENVIINHIQVHPSDKCLLVQTRDNTLRMIDLRVGIVMQRYLGALNFREHIRGCVSPCGTFVMSGSEDRCVYVWSAETGDQVAVYRDLTLPGAVCTIDYHPLDHSVAFGALLPNAPLLVYGFDVERDQSMVMGKRKAARQDAGLYTTGMFSPRSRPTSPVVNINNVNELESTRLNSSKALVEQEERLQTIRSERSQADSERFRSVVQKINSVTQMASMGTMHGVSMDNTLPGQSLGMTSTWGSTFDRTQVQAAYSMNLSLTESARQFAAQKEYMRQGTGDWRPQFAPIGKPPATMPLGRPPQMALTMTGNRATFAFHHAKNEKQGEMDEVVAVYDYQAQRATDLSFVRGDIIQVLYKENENWWLGQLSDGTQGYFPTNYVTGDDMTFAKQPSRIKPEEEEETKNDDEKETSGKKVNYSALVDKMGELHIMEEPGGDTEERPRRRKGKARSRTRRNEDGEGTQELEMTTMSTGDGGNVSTGRRRRSKARPSAESNA